jgi:hypothetical protein
MKMDCTEALERSSLRPLSTEGGTGSRAQGADPRDGALAHHLATCADCAREVAFMARLAGARPEPPSELLPAILVRTRRIPTPSGWWSGSMAAAAVLVLSLGVGLISHQADPPPSFSPLDALVMNEGLGDWEDDEWYVAGAPVLEALPDQMLLALLQEETW